MSDISNVISSGKAVLGIELGSTRIKAVLTDGAAKPIAQGSFEWENKLVDGLWSYGIDEVWNGLQQCYANLREDVARKYGVGIEKLAAIGISAMMHGYMPFGKDGEILVPFRTWRCTNTGEAAARLSELFAFNIPLRWSISHLYQAVLNGEEHVGDIDYLTTLAGYVHWKLTGKKVLGVGDASGMIPVDSATLAYDPSMVSKFDDLVSDKAYPWKLLDILPGILPAGADAGSLTPEGAALLDLSGHLKPGVPLCPPEGDAGTGMVATNAVRQRTGNVSAGTSSFSMIVLEKPLSRPYEAIDMVTTPDGSPVAMVHCNNCTSDLNAWVGLFKEFQRLLAAAADSSAGSAAAVSAAGSTAAAGPTATAVPSAAAGPAAVSAAAAGSVAGPAAGSAAVPAAGSAAVSAAVPAASSAAAGSVSTSDIFSLLFNAADTGDPDCGGLISYNYVAGEPLMGLNDGRPLFMRSATDKFNLANFIRSILYSTVCVLKEGNDILLKTEHVKVDRITAHGGLFKTPVIGQKILAAALGSPISVMDTAGEGGAWGIAVLASYMLNNAYASNTPSALPLPEYLDKMVFAGNEGVRVEPSPADVAGFEAYLHKYKVYLPVERTAVGQS